MILSQDPFTTGNGLISARRRRLALAGGLLFGASIAVSVAQAQSREHATMLLPFPPGGAGDLLARVLADKLKSELGRAVVVDNRPGAAIRIAGEALQRGPNDGSMVLLAPVDPMFIGPAIYANMRYDPARDFRPITDVAALQFGIAVAASSPIKTLKQYLESVQAQPRTADIGISLIGSLLHFLAIDFLAQAATRGVVVPYKGGAPMVTDLLGGQITAAMDASTTFMEFHRAGKIRVLAVSGDTRAASLPDVPTFAESGFASLVASSRYALYVRSDVPSARVDEWNMATRKVLASPDVQARLLSAGYDLVPGSNTAAVSDFTERSARRWLPVIQKSGFKGD
jgi:tripartite-type tricarboxylate transporter receptor subunit TctC